MSRSILVLLFVSVVAYSHSFAQTVSIPGYTGYATPAEDNEESMFSDSVGLHNWTNPHQSISYYFEANATGNLHLSILAKNDKGVSSIKASAAGKSFVIHIPQSKTFKEITVGDVTIQHAGFYQLTLQPVQSSTKNIAEIQSVQISGEAAVNSKFNTKSRRNAASVHLMYPVPDSLNIVSFYNEVTVPKGADIPYSYYMACGFTRGYFGIQVNSNKERRVIFSVWDAGNEAVDRNKVSDTNKMRLIAKGENVIASDFGNEGTGGHSHLIYNWKADSTYKFLVTALPDSATNTTTYSGYFFAPELKAWKLIASFRAPKDGQNLHHLYSFLEDFVGTTGQKPRKAFYNNAWIQDEDGKWMEVNKATFSTDATGRAKDRTDFGGGVQNNRFYLWNGGFTPANAKYGDAFTRDTTGKKPVINYYHHVDSALQARKDIATIKKAVEDGVIDTTKSVKGVYYKILTEGTGPTVSVTDTLSVFYKGSILNGGGFESSEKEPVTFPLNRLIKGWQIGLTQCKVGGKIRLIIPSGLAYSIRSRAFDIPPNSILIFDIEVLSAKKAE